MKISGFTFGHDCLRGGYPVAEAIAAVRPFVDEVVAVDMESTDGTRAVLERLCDHVLDSPWRTDRKPMDVAFLKHVQCAGDAILLFEADEVFAPSLAKAVVGLAKAGHRDLRVWRLQVAQNGQRLPWAPHPVHRLFPKGLGTYLDNPVVAPDSIPVVSAEHGYLWDVTMWFRDCYWDRRRAHSEAWGSQRNVLAREHFLQSAEVSDRELAEILAAPHWAATESPFALPDLVKGLVGMTTYRPTV